MSEPGASPTRHSQVRGYTSNSSTARSLASFTSCLPVTLTTSVNSIMDCSVKERALGPHRPRERTVVGGYEIRSGSLPVAVSWPPIREVAILTALSLPPACKRWWMSFHRTDAAGGAKALWFPQMAVVRWVNLRWA